MKVLKKTFFDGNFGEGIRVNLVDYIVYKW